MAHVLLRDILLRLGLMVPARRKVTISHLSQLYMPRTRAEEFGREIVSVVDPNTGELYQTYVSRTGRLGEKNRSTRDPKQGGKYVYKSHLTEKQRKIIRWALRQRDRGCTKEQIYEYIMLNQLWQTQPMQYPLAPGTILSWVMTRAALEKRGKQWP